MQGIELRHALVIETDYLGIENGSALDARRLFDDARVAVGPIGPVHRVETLDLQRLAECVGRRTVPAFGSPETILEGLGSGIAHSGKIFPSLHWYLGRGQRLDKERPPRLG